MKRIPVALAGLGVVALAAIPATSAGADPATFSWSSNSVTVTTGTCNQDSCSWRLSVDVPATGQFIGLAGPTSASGTALTVSIPLICATVQADLEHINAHGNWEVEVGHVQTFSSCPPPPTTTTQPPPTTTTQPPPTTTVPPIVPKPPASQPPVSGPPSVSAPAGVPTNPGSTAPAGAPAAAVPSTPTAATMTGPPVLAYTGINWKPLAAIGSGLVGLGLLLMRRRRVAS